MKLLLSLLALIAIQPQAKQPMIRQVPLASYRNLAVYPIFEPLGYVQDSAYITLDEGLKAGTVTVSEHGSGSPIIRQRGSLPRTPNPPEPASQEYQEGAEVNTLWLTNLSGKRLLLISGEMVRGGQQDRIIGKDTIIPSSKEPVDIGVFCVEHGRWSGKQSFDAPAESFSVVAPSIRDS